MYSGLHFYITCKLSYSRIPIGDQSDGHDVPQHGPRRKQLVADEGSAGWTQTLIVQSDRHWRDRRYWSGGIHLHTLLLNLKGEMAHENEAVNTTPLKRKQFVMRVKNYALNLILVVTVPEVMPRTFLFPVKHLSV